MGSESADKASPFKMVLDIDDINKPIIYPPKVGKVRIMRVKMKETRKGVNDGDIYPKEYQKGKEYNIGKNLGDVFVGEGWADEVKAKKGHENKAKKVTENKGKEASEDK